MCKKSLVPFPVSSLVGKVNFMLSVSLESRVVKADFLKAVREAVV